MTDAERFAARVNLTPTCHYWTGATDRDGYGSFNADGKKYRAHVYAYIQAHGEIEAGLELDHLCHRRNCVNPAHLEPKTHADNLAQREDRIAKPFTVIDEIYLDDPTADAREDEASTAGETNVLGEPIARDQNGRWLKGTRPQPLGRIQKQPTMLDETIALAHAGRNRRRIAKAWVETMVEAGTAAGNRARSDFSDRAYGLPKQTLVLEQGDSPLAALLERLASRQAPAYIEGEARVIDITPAVDAHSET